MLRPSCAAGVDGGHGYRPVSLGALKAFIVYRPFIHGPEISFEDTSNKVRLSKAKVSKAQAQGLHDSMITKCSRTRDCWLILCKRSKGRARRKEACKPRCSSHSNPYRSPYNNHNAPYLLADNNHSNPCRNPYRVPLFTPTPTVYCPEECSEEQEREALFLEGMLQACGRVLYRGSIRVS